MSGGMKQADSEEWFREKDFRKDVLRYLKRQGIIEYRDLASLTSISPSALEHFLRGGSLVPRTMGALASVCDLDLNSYVLTQSQHDDYMDSKHQRSRKD